MSYPNGKIITGQLAIGPTNTEFSVDVNGNIGIGFNSQIVSLDTNRTDAYKLPKGTTVQRPTANSTTQRGYVRYNTTTDQFEGFGAGDSWGSLGGVIDVDQDTYISAETSAGVDNDELKFYTSGNERLVIDSTGHVEFPIGNSRASIGIFPDLNNTNYTGTTGTGITNTTKNVEGFQLIDKWLDTYLLDTPPAPTLSSSGNDSTKIFIEWTNIPQKQLGFYNVYIPQISEMRIDYVKSSLNSNQDWAHSSTVTINTGTIATGSSISCNRVEVFVDGLSSNSGMVGTTWKEYAIETEIAYDLRIYGVNEQDGRTIKYLAVLNLGTATSGSPSITLNFSATGANTTQINTTWTKPTDHDTITPGNQTEPLIEEYEIDYAATSSVRYGGYLTHTNDVSTGTVSGSNQVTNLSITSLNPGTDYLMKARGKNSISLFFGPYSATNSGTTSQPSQPGFLTTGNSTTIYNLNVLKGTYSNAYSLDGTSLGSNIINFNIINDATQPIRTISSTNIQMNVTPGNASASVGTIYAYGGNTTSYTSNEINVTTPGYNQTSINGNHDDSGNIIRLIISNDGDYYSTDANNNQYGFWRRMNLYVQALNTSTNFFPAINSYSLRLKQIPIGGATVQTNQIVFYIDDANTTTTVNNVAIVSESNSSSIQRISGVPTFKTNAVFTLQWNQTEVAHYFLNSNRKHTTAIVKTSGNSSMSSTLTIDQTDIGAIHKYYTAPTSNKYQTSTTLHNTSGTLLDATSSPEEIQFSDFAISLSNNANNKFDEDFKIHVTPYSLYSPNGAVNVSNAYVSTADGSTKKLRIDTNSINNDRSSSGNSSNSSGQHVRSGSGDYPSIGTGATDAGDTYDHDEDISSHASYVNELQLISGIYKSPTSAGSNGYKSYSGFYFPGGITLPDYSGITSNSSYRYHTLKYTGAISSGTYERVRIILTQTGLTVDFSQFDVENHQLFLRAVGDSSYETGWLNCSNAVGVNGVGWGFDGTRCVSTGTSTVTQRDCYVRSGTDSNVVFYIRIGLKNNINCSITNISLSAVSSF
jgi:hypothetical protein